MENKGFICDLLNSFAEADEKLVAFSIYDGTQQKDITYHRFLDDILKVAGYFKEHGFHRCHIALIAPNSYEWVVTFFAITASGNVAVLLNQDLPRDIMQWQCQKADISLICCDDFAGFKDSESLFSAIPCLSYKDICCANPLQISCVDIPGTIETITMIFTSGTTGESKVVEITDENLRYSLYNLDPSYSIKGMERLFTPIPFYHIAGLTTVLEALNQKKTECLGRGMKYIFMDMPILNPTTINAVPSIVESLLKIFRKATSVEERKKFVGDNLCLICVSGAVLKPSVSKFFKDLGMDVSVYYGMSEVTGAATWMLMDENHLGATGKFCEHTQYCFQDGELLLKGPTLMKGYYKDPVETEKVIGTDWIYTGDMGYCNEDGYLYLTGRKKNVIILSNGENVNPEEVEEKLGVCPYIQECMVYSDGKGICADIYTENKEMAMSFVKQYNAGTPLYRQVYKVTYYDIPLEKTGSGKIKRKVNVYV